MNFSKSTLQVLAALISLACATAVHAEATVRAVALSGQTAPGTSQQFLNFQDAVINNSGRVSFMAQIVPNGPQGSIVGIWSEGSGSLSNVTQYFFPAPGTSGTFQQLESGANEMNFDDAGNVGFRAQVGILWGVWTGGSGGLSNLMYQGNPAPVTTAGTTFGFPSQVLMNNSGAVTFTTQLNGPNPNPFVFNEALWTTIGGTFRAVAVANNPAPGIPGSVLAGLGTPSMNNAGLVAFTGSFLSTSVSSSTTDALWVGDPNAPVPIFLTGMAAPGTSGLNFASFGPVSLNSSGHVAFWGNLAGTSPASSVGFWSNADGTLRLMARQGDAATGLPGSTYDKLDRFRLSSSGRAVFAATALGSDNVDRLGIWAEQAGNTQLIAASGMQAPGLPAGAVFDNLSSPDINASGLVVFDAHVLGLGMGIWADDPQGNLFPVVLPTDTLGVGKQILAISLVPFTGGDASGQPRYVNDAGQLSFVTTFSDDSEGVFVATVPEPTAISAAALLPLLVRKRRAMSCAAAKGRTRTVMPLEQPETRPWVEPPGAQANREIPSGILM